MIAGVYFSVALVIWQKMYSICVLFLFFFGSLAFVVDPYIYGGEKATKNQFPFIVSLRKLENGTFIHDCGASIISEQFLLTAAHCYHSNLELSDNRISVGAHMREDQGELYNIERFIVHPQYQALAKANDIALVKTKEPIRLNENAKTIEISRNFIDRNEKAIAIGWGSSEVIQIA